MRTSDGGPTILAVTTISLTVRAFLLPHLEGFHRAGYRVEVASNITNDDLNEGELSHYISAIHHVDLSRQPSQLLEHLRSFFQLRKLSKQVDIVEVHTPIAATLTRLACASTGTPCVYFAHGFHFHSGSRNVWFWIERWLAQWTHHIFVINDEDRTAAEELLNVRRTAISKIAGIGLDIDHYSKVDKTLAAFTNEIAVIGSLTDEKGTRELPLIAKALPANYRMIVAGDGPLQDWLAAQILAEGLEDRIIMLGQVSDIRQVFCRARVLLFPSYREGLPRTVLEAVASGVPVVAFRIRGVVDILDGKDWWFEPESRAADSIAAAIEDAITADLNHSEMSESLSNFAERAVVDAHVKTIGNIMNSAGSA